MTDIAKAVRARYTLEFKQETVRLVASRARASRRRHGRWVGRTDTVQLGQGAASRHTEGGRQPDCG